MSKVTVTKAEMNAVKEQRDRYKRNLNEVIKIALGKSAEYGKFCEGSEPLNYMSTEQIVLAWHSHVEVIPNIKYVQMGEAMVASDKGETVYFHSEYGDVKRIKPTEAINVSIADMEINNETLMDLLRGKWSIEG